jgi:pimeloyl-ACP methyl ester carboxylesterase
MFFGETGRQLFGVYHPAATARPKRTGVVLCYPAPQEYRQAHWGYRKLANLLADEGFHVLRFDYFATGDSAGSSTEGSLAQWTRDVGTAAAELQDVAGVSRISLVGMRLGAAIAVRASALNPGLSDLVLWDPTVTGRAYLAQLDALHVSALRATRYPQDDSREPGELLGFSTPALMRDAIAQLDLAQEPYGTPSRVFLICAADRLEFQRLRGRFEGNGTPFDYALVEDATLSSGGDLRSDTLLAHRVPAAIAAYLAARVS